MLLVKKKDNGSSLCVDYRWLKKLMIKNKYLLREIVTNAPIVYMDCMNRILHEREYVVMFFVVTNAPIVCMDYMNRIFHPLLDKFVVIFINDRTVTEIRNFIGLARYLISHNKSLGPAKTDSKPKFELDSQLVPAMNLRNRICFGH
ncbi:hypothetical protein CR513_20122, partial [Mucuna pruriens]